MMSIYFTRNFQRGFGTFPLKGADARRAMEHAIDVGYRAFDTAQMYGNEADIGAAIAESGLPRDAFCITTKVLPANFPDATFLPSVEDSLRALQVDKVDVLLLHWPPIGGDVVPSLRLLDAAHGKGLAAHIGVSNYTSAMMRIARDTVSVPLVANQVEFHPLLNQDVPLAASAETGIPLVSYCSLARGRVFEAPVLAEIGARVGKNAAQVVLRWIQQKGVASNTMSTRPENIRANYDIMDFALSTVDMARIDALSAAQYRICNADLVPFAPEWD